MITAWVLVLAAGATGTGSAFDPKAYIQARPVETEDEDEDVLEEDAQLAVSEVAKRVALEKLRASILVWQADLKVDGKLVVALKSSFGTIYIAKADGITERALESATCATERPEPTDVSPTRQLDDAAKTLEPAIIKAIETHCKPAPAGGPGDKVP